MMGMFVGGRLGAISEVNVVPLIDILLVLLVIFMIIPVHSRGLEAQIPQDRQDGVNSRPVDVVVVQVLADGSVWIDREPTAWGALGAGLEKVFRFRADRTVFIRGDGAVEFSVVASVIDVMHASGVESVGLLTPELEKASRF
jgi:biopolymer transport protein TolR